MELGANRKSLTQLGVLLAVLGVVVYVQFFSGESPVPEPVRPASDGASPQAARRAPPAVRRMVGGGGQEPSRDLGGQPPADGSMRIRRELLERVRAVTAPAVERDIFNFGRPKPRQIMGPTREEVQLAQQRFEEESKPAPKPVEPPPAPVVPKPQPKPPAWQYFGLADSPASGAKRALLLDGEEILIAEPGSVLEGRFQVTAIDADAIHLRDVSEGHEFALQLEAGK